METRKFLVEIKDTGKRLDLFLAFYNNDLTRTFIKGLIATDKIKINEEIVFKSNYRVKNGDSIEMEVRKEEIDLPIAEDLPLNVVYEDDHLVVINKESGMVVHPGSGHFEGTVVNALLYKYKDMNSIGDSVRAGLIHRLDKDTSGLLLIAKTNEGLSYYTKLFANRNVVKKYLAVSCGILPKEFLQKDSVVIQNFLARSVKNRQKYTVVDDNGKFAHSEIQYLASSGKYHLMNADIKTGRTHQIRIHLQTKGLPVLGDLKYGRTKYKRLMLHAWYVKIKLLNGKEMIFKAKPPQDFVELFPLISQYLDSVDQ